MEKSVYFVIEVLWSLVVSSICWYGALKNASFDFYGNSDDTLMGIFLVVGLVVMVLLTLGYILLGKKVVKEWKAWMIPISLGIMVATGFLGIYVVVYGTEFLNRVH